VQAIFDGNYFWAGTILWELIILRDLYFGWNYFSGKYTFAGIL
jgi:hypothetical protein